MCVECFYSYGICICPERLSHHRWHFSSKNCKADWSVGKSLKSQYSGGWGRMSTSKLSQAVESETLSQKPTRNNSHKREFYEFLLQAFQLFCQSEIVCLNTKSHPMSLNLCGKCEFCLTNSEGRLEFRQQDAQQCNIHQTNISSFPK